MTERKKISRLDVIEKAKRLRVDICEFEDFDPVLIKELCLLLFQVECDYRRGVIRG